MSEIKRPEKIEKLAELVHKAYCQYCIEVKGKEYWTKGDYSLLSNEVKEADRYTVRAVLKGIEKFLPSVEEIKHICKQIVSWGSEHNEDTETMINEQAQAIHKRIRGNKNLSPEISEFNFFPSK